MKTRSIFIIVSTIFSASCSSGTPPIPEVPALKYADTVRGTDDPSTVQMRNSSRPGRIVRNYESLHEQLPAENVSPTELIQPPGRSEQMASLTTSPSPYFNSYYPGEGTLNPSLWRETSNESDLFHDQRAWRPMDLITIVVSEKAEGSKKADTNVKTESTIKTAIQKLFGLEKSVVERNPDVNPAALIQADASSEFKGEGETTRKDNLVAKLSAMVAEVLPSGILRVEGKKIISVNNEEQIMVISGLVRTSDVTSKNEVDSSKIANMRIDYYGRGSVGDAQTGGWLGNLVRLIWPF